MKEFQCHIGSLSSRITWKTYYKNRVFLLEHLLWKEIAEVYNYVRKTKQKCWVL